ESMTLFLSPGTERARSEGAGPCRGNARPDRVSGDIEPRHGDARAGERRQQRSAPIGASPEIHRDSPDPDPSSTLAPYRLLRGQGHRDGKGRRYLRLPGAHTPDDSKSSIRKTAPDAPHGSPPC